MAQYISARSRELGVPDSGLTDVQWERTPTTGLRTAARDLVEWCQDVSGDALSELDAELSRASAPTLTAMRHAGYRSALAVLSRGEIRTEEEWHLLNALLTDTANRTLSPAEREDATRLALDYEARAASRRGPT